MLKEVKEKTGLTYMMAESSWYRQECIFAHQSSFKGGEQLDVPQFERPKA